jgi:catechol 2,3-dioxygenase-like lactoylglutathione lyase family enzyme
VSAAAAGAARSLSAVTLVTADMAASVAFYEALGFERRYGGPDAPFTSFGVGEAFLNLQLDPRWVPPAGVWGRAIFWVDDVDAVHSRALSAGLRPEGEPRDAPWGERYFHVRDPAGHEVSIAKPLAEPATRPGPGHPGP